MSRSIIYECDDCHDTFDTGHTDDTTARRAASNAGWQATGAADYCSGCRADDDFTPSPHRSTWMSGSWD